ncbi:adenylate/guanylate cyclase domain-containing protein [Actinomarinicola tropica]|uniref:adenylate/guanylate cyclase domain-containing protein n=1 Tax=Actinomarinicola tropica TaxID=2789776 RepID=UPI001896FACB|nr:adenylate/guanylate cyclase domain-containing protein [Actinomarinicola tropica]
MSPGSYEPEAVGRRVRRTFGFVDLSGFTTLTAREGDEEAVRVLTVFRNAVRSVAGYNGVRVAKWLGDGAMLVSTETRPMVEAILEIEQRIDADGSGLPLRAGITAGDVILFEGDDYVGSSVNLAARLCDSAEPCQVLAPVDVVEALGRTPDEVDRLVLRGMTEPIEVVDLQRELAPPSRTGDGSSPVRDRPSGPAD